MTNSKVCPKCNAENPVAANFCRMCRYEFPEISKNGESLSPKIASFRIIEDDYVIGSKINIEWNVENATEIFLDGEDVSVYSSCEREVERPARLRLLAKNDYDEVSKEIAIRPKQMPVIKRLRSSLSMVRIGQPIKISWVIENSPNVTIRTSDTNINVSPVNSMEIRPKHTQDIIIACESYDPKVIVEKSIHIDVIEDVNIVSFKSDSSFIIESRPTKLRWIITGADRLTLYPQNLDVTHITEIEIFPRCTTTYRIIASNRISNKESTVTVGVQPLPQIDSSLITPLSSIKIPSIGDGIQCDDTHLKRLTKRLMEKPTQKVEKDIRERSILNRLKKDIQEMRSICSLDKIFLFHRRSFLLKGITVINIIMSICLVACSLLLIGKGSCLTCVGICSMACISYNCLYYHRFIANPDIQWKHMALHAIFPFISLLTGALPLFLLCLTHGNLSIFSEYGWTGFMALLGEYDLKVPLSLIAFISLVFWYEVIAIHNESSMINIHNKLKRQLWK